VLCRDAIVVFIRMVTAGVEKEWRHLHQREWLGGSNLDIRKIKLRRLMVSI